MITLRLTKRSWLVLLVLVTAALDIRTAGQSSREPAVSVRRVPVDRAVVPGDFNGDGIVDLASTSRTPAVGFKPVVVAIGRGDGTFNTPAPAPVNGAVLATGDFNEDGALDLVVSADEDDAPLRWLPGRGDGTFAAPIKIGGAVVSGFTFAKAVDFDGDGHLDLAVGFSGVSDHTGVLFYRGFGDGTFTEVIARIDTGDFTAPLGAAVADLNHDGRPDLALASHAAQLLSIFINQGSFAFTGTDRQMANAANDVAAADVNNDGNIDLVVAESVSNDGDVSYSSGSVWVYLGNGDGTIAQFGRVYSMGRGAWRIVTGDFNRDGRLDIATANRSAIAVADCGRRDKTWDSLSILTGNGDGTFASSGSTDYSIGNQQDLDDGRFRNDVWSLAAADMNRDGAADLVASSGVVFINNPPDPNWAPSVTAGSDQTFTNTHTVTLHAVADDVDQDVLQYVWDNNAGLAIPEVPNPCVTVPGDGTFRFVVTVFDRHGHSARAEVHYTFTGGGGYVYPQVDVSAPTTGEVIPAGVPYTIRWTAKAGTYPISRFNVRFVNAGQPSWIPGCTNLPASTTSCTWNSPGPPTESASIDVEAVPTVGPSAATSVGPVSIRDAGTSPLPSGWLHADVGSVGAAGTATFNGYQYDGEVYTVSGSGADIWNTADEFHFVWKSMTGNFEINTRVGSIDPVDAWTKAGPMMRVHATDPSSPHVSLFATPGKGIAFQRRMTQGGASIHTAGPAFTAPVYLRLVRDGDTVFAYYRKNPTDPWTLLASQTMSGLAATVDVGFAVSSHSDGRVATAKFQGSRLAALPKWTATAIGGASGSAAVTNGTNVRVTGSGADIWGTSDGLEYLWIPLSGNGVITARILNVQNVHAWTKAGVMVRESLDANAKQVDAFVTPGKGFAMQYRDTTGGESVSVKQVGGAAPGWVRLYRSVGGSTGSFQALYSTDGLIWRQLGIINLNMANDVFIGLAVASHNASAEATATFDDVRIDR